MVTAVAIPQRIAVEPPPVWRVMLTAELPEAPKRRATLRNLSHARLQGVVQARVRDTSLTTFMH